MGLGPEGWGKVLLIASGVTTSVAVSGFLIGTVIGAALARGRIAGNRTVRIAAEFYTTLMRSIPELLVI